MRLLTNRRHSMSISNTSDSSRDSQSTTTSSSTASSSAVAAARMLPSPRSLIQLAIVLVLLLAPMTHAQSTAPTTTTPTQAPPPTSTTTTTTTTIPPPRVFTPAPPPTRKPRLTLTHSQTVQVPEPPFVHQPIKFLPPIVGQICVNTAAAAATIAGLVGPYPLLPMQASRLLLLFEVAECGEGSSLLDSRYGAHFPITAFPGLHLEFSSKPLVVDYYRGGIVANVCCAIAVTALVFAGGAILQSLKPQLAEQEDGGAVWKAATAGMFPSSMLVLQSLFLGGTVFMVCATLAQSDELIIDVCIGVSMILVLVVIFGLAARSVRRIIFVDRVVRGYSATADVLNKEEGLGQMVRSAVAATLFYGRDTWHGGRSRTTPTNVYGNREGAKLPPNARRIALLFKFFRPPKSASITITNLEQLFVGHYFFFEVLVTTVVAVFQSTMTVSCTTAVWGMAGTLMTTTVVSVFTRPHLVPFTQYLADALQFVTALGLMVIGVDASTKSQRHGKTLREISDVCGLVGVALCLLAGIMSLFSSFAWWKTGGKMIPDRGELQEIYNSSSRPTSPLNASYAARIGGSGLRRTPNSNDNTAPLLPNQQVAGARLGGGGRGGGGAAGNSNNGRNGAPRSAVATIPLVESLLTPEQIQQAVRAEWPPSESNSRSQRRTNQNDNASADNTYSINLEDDDDDDDESPPRTQHLQVSPRLRTGGGSDGASKSSRGGLTLATSSNNDMAVSVGGGASSDDDGSMMALSDADDADDDPQLDLSCSDDDDAAAAGDKNKLKISNRPASTAGSNHSGGKRRGSSQSNHSTGAAAGNNNTATESSAGNNNNNAGVAAKPPQQRRRAATVGPINNPLALTATSPLSSVDGSSPVNSAASVAAAAMVGTRGITPQEHRRLVMEIQRMKDAEEEAAIDAEEARQAAKAAKKAAAAATASGDGTNSSANNSSKEDKKKRKKAVTPQLSSSRAAAVPLAPGSAAAANPFASPNTGLPVHHRRSHSDLARSASASSATQQQRHTAFEFGGSLVSPSPSRSGSVTAAAAVAPPLSSHTIAQWQKQQQQQQLQLSSSFGSNPNNNSSDSNLFLRLYNNSSNNRNANSNNNDRSSSQQAPMGELQLDDSSALHALNSSDGGSTDFSSPPRSRAFTATGAGANSNNNNNNNHDAAGVRMRRQDDDDVDSSSGSPASPPGPPGLAGSVTPPPSKSGHNHQKRSGSSGSKHDKQQPQQQQQYSPSNKKAAASTTPRGQQQPAQQQQLSSKDQKRVQQRMEALARSDSLMSDYHPPKVGGAPGEEEI